MDTIPEALYQEILSYLIDEDSSSLRDIFQNHHNLPFINKTFQQSFIRYFKKPIRLYISNWKEACEVTLQVIQFAKKCDIPIHDLIIDFHDGDDDYCPSPIIIKAMYGINLTSLRKLELQSLGRHFDFKILEECTELSDFTFGLSYSRTLKDQRIAEELKTFLSFKKDSLEYLKFPVNDNETYNGIFPEDLSWPNLKKLTLTQIDVSRSKRIESSTLQHLLLEGFSKFRSDGELVIKCPNLKVLLINCIDQYHHNTDEIELSERTSKSSDVYRFYTYTCHPSELRKIGMVIDVSSDCDIGVRIYERS